MSADKYPSIFSRKWNLFCYCEAIIIFQIFIAAGAVLKIGERRSDIPQF